MLQTLEEWASVTFTGVKPSIITMRRWAVYGLLHPRAKKVGRTWFVEQGTVFVGRTRSDVGHRRNDRG